MGAVLSHPHHLPPSPLTSSIFLPVSPLGWRRGLPTTAPRMVQGGVGERTMSGSGQIQLPNPVHLLNFFVTFLMLTQKEAENILFQSTPQELCEGQIK